MAYDNNIITLLFLLRHTVDTVRARACVYQFVARDVYTI